jgi:hypothetical protein
MSEKVQKEDIILGEPRKVANNIRFLEQFYCKYGPVWAFLSTLRGEDALEAKSQILMHAVHVYLRDGGRFIKQAYRVGTLESSGIVLVPPKDCAEWIRSRIRQLKCKNRAKYDRLFDPLSFSWEQLAKMDPSEVEVPQKKKAKTTAISGQWRYSKPYSKEMAGVDDEYLKAENLIACERCTLYRPIEQEHCSLCWFHNLRPRNKGGTIVDGSLRIVDNAGVVETCSDWKSAVATDGAELAKLMSDDDSESDDDDWSPLEDDMDLESWQREQDNDDKYREALVRTKKARSPHKQTEDANKCFWKLLQENADVDSLPCVGPLRKASTMPGIGQSSTYLVLFVPRWLSLQMSGTQETSSGRHVSAVSHRKNFRRWNLAVSCVIVTKRPILKVC